MAKIIEGVALLATAAVMIALTAGAASPFVITQMGIWAVGMLLSVGASLTLSGIASALKPGQTAPFSIRQPAAPRQIIYGQMRVSGIIVYLSTTNNGHDLNQVIAWAGHSCQSIDTVYVDGRATHISGNVDNGSSYNDDSGNSYKFGSLVHLWNSLGGTPGSWFSDLGGRDSKWTSDCRLDGITATYIRTSFDAATFSGMPGIKANLHGKNTIYDPRTGTSGYSENAALIIADFMCNNEWGIGSSYGVDIDIPQLIAAANLCDEPVTLANGTTEPRYTINGYFDTSSTAGDILDAMLQACEGRMTYTGGLWKIFPAAFWGSGLSFDADDMAGPVKWSPRRKYRDLVNAVRGSFVSPKYPYTTIGYNRDNKDSNIWSGQWQPTDYPEYAQDAAHGYVSDANMAADGGYKLYADRPYRFVTSVATAQRLAKIFLLRNRQQGSGTLTMQLSAYQAQAQDVIQVSMAALGWTNKYLEIQSFRFVPQTDSNDQNAAPTLHCELDVVETDPSVYLWSTAEERGPENTTSPTVYNAMQVNPPTSVTLTSGSTTAVNGADGVVIPRILITWIEPDDPFVLSGGYVEIQWRLNSSSTWLSAGRHDPALTAYYLNGVVAGQQYVVQLRAVRSNGAASAWVVSTPHTVSSTASSISYANISGLGALATKNFVDFASGDVANRSAANLTYSTGLTVEALRPAEPGAQSVAGKSIDLLADGSVYVRVKSSEATGGVIVGKSFGHNMLGNPGFELALQGNSFTGDDWLILQNAACWAYGRETSSGHTGSADMLVRLSPNQTVPSGVQPFRLLSPAYPIIGGSPVAFGGYFSWTATAAIPAGLSIAARIAAWFTDANGNMLNEATLGDILTIPFAGAWTAYTGTATAPTNAVYVALELMAFTNNASPVTISGSQLYADMRFDDMFLSQQITNSSVLNSQGSIMPNQPITVAYNVTKNSLTFTWSAQTMIRSDGSTLAIPSGSKSYTGLSSATTYYTYWYAQASNGTLQQTNGSPPPSTPNGPMAAQTGLDGRISIGTMSVTTLVATNNGTGSGTGGGGDTCPEAAELVDVRDRGLVRAGDVKQDDWIKGHAFKANADVYRRVVQVRSSRCVAWRIVNGHKVSPCEPVFVEGKWMPAYQASAEVDTSIGSKLYISVEVDDYDEQNYYLVEGTPLLIHNYAQTGQFNPC